MIQNLISLGLFFSFDIVSILMLFLVFLILPLCLLYVFYQIYFNLYVIDNWGVGFSWTSV